MTELEKIEYTKSFIDKLADGINPLDDSAIPEGDLLNNVRISRCMFYVSGILQNVCDHLRKGDSGKKRKVRKAPFNITAEQLGGYDFSEYPVYLSDIVDKLNALVSKEDFYRLKFGVVMEWLVCAELVTTVTDQDGFVLKVPTQKGEAYGITAETRMGSKGRYSILTYNTQAQRFILDHIADIMEINNKKREEKSSVVLENQGRAWDGEQDERLKKLFREGYPIEVIATEMKRTEGGIRARLVKLGLIENRDDV